MSNTEKDLETKLISDVELPFFLRGKTSLGKIIEPNKPGRPTRSDIDIVQTRLWFSAIQYLSGLPSAYAIEMALDGDHIKKRDVDIMRPRKWDQYAAGDTSPTGKKGSVNSVDLAEQHFPGTAIFYRSAIWQILREIELSQDDIDKGLQSLGQGITDLIFEAYDLDTPSLLCQKAIDESTIDQIVNLGGFHSLSALVLLVAQAKVIASPALRELALNGYANLLPSLRHDPIVGKLLSELMPVIDRSCKHWAFLSANRRFQVVIFSQGILDNYDRQNKVNGDIEQNS